MVHGDDGYLFTKHSSHIDWKICSHRNYRMVAAYSLSNLICYRVLYVLLCAKTKWGLPKESKEAVFSRSIAFDTYI